MAQKTLATKEDIGALFTQIMAQLISLTQQITDLNNSLQAQFTNFVKTVDFPELD